MTEIPNSESLFLQGGKTGVLILHGFTGSPASVRPWALGIHESGYTVSAPRLAGHGTRWEDLNNTSWREMYASAESAFLTLKESCDRVFVAGFSVGGALALRLSQIRGSEIEGLILLNPSIFDDRKFFRALPVLKHVLPSIPGGRSDIAQPNPTRHGYDRIPLKALDSVRKLWAQVEEDLYLVDLPLLIGYSINDHVVAPACSQTIIDNVFSPSIREIIFEKSFHNVSLDYEVDDLIAESTEFLEDVLAGTFESTNEDDETQLINAEFESIISGLSLDESTPNTFLDELDRVDDEHFVQPNPPMPNVDQLARWAIIGLLGGPAYLLIEFFTGFSFFGTGPWIGILGFIGGVVASIMKFARKDDDYDDGAIL